MSERKTTRQSTGFLQNFFSGIQRFLRETIGELRKVSWPTRQEAVHLTLVVIVVIILMTLFLGLLDGVFAKLFAWYVRL